MQDLRVSSLRTWSGGGIKYLETLEFSLVRKLCKARNHLLEHYPANIKEVRFFVTLEKGFRFGRLFLYFGALFYWLIGNFFTRAPRILSKKRIHEDEPVVKTENIQGGFEYSDAYLKDNDARFVFHFIRAALDHGGAIANYVEALKSDYKKDKEIWVTRATDKESGKTFSIKSRLIINACGPFADQLNEVSKVKTEHHHLFSKGVHLIVNRLSPNPRVLTFFADDGRLFFVIPMGNKHCIGTTDTRVEKLPPFVTDEDRQFILSNINKRLNLMRPLTKKDIIAERCGVRPLVVEAKPATGRKKDTGDWTSLSRKHAIEADRAIRHISIFGGKLTDCLNVGEEIAELCEEMGISLPYRDIQWYGEPPEAVRKEFFHQARLMELDKLTARESSEPISSRLWRRYGASALRLLEEIRIDPSMAEVLIKGTEYLKCELHHVARREMIVKLEDFLRRRSKIALVESPSMIRRAPGLKEACKILFGKDADRRLKEYFTKH